MIKIKSRAKIISIVLCVALAGLTFGVFLSWHRLLFDDYRSNQKPQAQVVGARITPDNQSPNATDSAHVQTDQEAKVVRVVDGDTIEISAIGGPVSGGEGWQRVRYIGINTPETVDPRKAVQCFGQEAAAKNRELVEGKTVSLEKDVSETDKYGRLLRYVYLPAHSGLSSSGSKTGEAGVDQVFVNDYLVRQGYAYSSSYPPDIRYQDQLQNAEQEARENTRGLWGSCAKGDAQLVPQSLSQEECAIKGNISSSGEKIYHLPDQRYYNQTVIDESRGERWFCSQDEAINAGWRKSKV